MLNWVIIQTFHNRSEAELAKSALEANGIPAIIKADDQGGMRPELAFSFGVRLMVQEADLEQAREVLEPEAE